MSTLVIVESPAKCKKIEKFLGSQGIHILRKIFGIILLAIGIKLFTTNIKLIFS